MRTWPVTSTPRRAEDKRRSLRSERTRLDRAQRGGAGVYLSVATSTSAFSARRMSELNSASTTSTMLEYLDCLTYSSNVSLSCGMDLLQNSMMNSASSVPHLFSPARFSVSASLFA